MPLDLQPAAAAAPSDLPPAAGRPPVRGAERALVLGDDFGIFLAVVRSLGRRRVEVDVVPAEADSPGLSSRYVSSVRRLPPYREDGLAWAGALSALIGERDYRLVIPCGDNAVAFLDHHAPLLGRERLAIANPAALAAFTDKAATRALADRLGVRMPRGRPVAEADTAAALAGELGLPLVLKPRRSYALGGPRSKQPVEIVRTEAELRFALAAPRKGWLAEAFFAGEGVGVSVFARGGRIELAWQHRRLREISDAGASSLRAGEPLDPALVADVEALAAVTALEGIAMFEFRQDPASGEHVLLEVNPRFWGSLPLALAAGADFPAMLWDAASGRALASCAVSREGLVRRSMTAELDRIGNAADAAGTASGRLRALAGLAPLAASLVRPERFDSWAADDPAPFHAERRRVARRLAASIAKRMARS